MRNENANIRSGILVEQVQETLLLALVKSAISIPQFISCSGAAALWPSSKKNVSLDRHQKTFGEGWVSDGHSVWPIGSLTLQDRFVEEHN